MALYIIAIGGTGAKCVEAIVYTAAIGIFTKEPIRILFVDQDESNGNVTHARTTIETYKHCYDLFNNDPRQTWMQTEVEMIGDVWSPVKGENKTLGNFFDYNSYRYKNPKAGYLFDVLFTEADRETSLEDGFRGRPAIGSAVMSQLNLEEEEPWKTLINKIETDNKGKVFLCGSVFGGTGASGLPTISRLIDSQFKNKIEIGGLLMLPYFTFPVQQAPTNQIYAHPERFLVNTEVALRYYRSQARNQTGQSSQEGYIAFDAIYLLGMPELSQVNDEFSLGRARQRNNPHIMELYAALAAQHFLQSTPQDKITIIRRNNPNFINWDDIPERNEVQKRLVNATRFAFAWTRYFFPKLTDNSINNRDFAKQNPWFEKFFATPANQKLPQLASNNEQNALTQINKWCTSYLNWLQALNTPETVIQLFQTSHFTNDINDLSELVAGQYGSERRQTDTINRLTNELEKNKNASQHKGTVGLAKAFYKLCE